MLEILDALLSGSQVSQEPWQLIKKSRTTSTNIEIFLQYYYYRSCIELASVADLDPGSTCTANPFGFI
jgi:hypothetical protein